MSKGSSLGERVRAAVLYLALPILAATGCDRDAVADEAKTNRSNPNATSTAGAPDEPGMNRRRMEAANAAVKGKYLEVRVGSAAPKAIQGPPPVGPDPIVQKPADSLEQVTARLSVLDIMKAAMIYNNVPQFSTERRWYKKRVGRRNGKPVYRNIVKDVKIANLSVFLALCHLESNFKFDEISKVDAVGLCQMLPVTARHAGRILSRSHPDFKWRKTVKIYNPVYRRVRRRNRQTKKWETLEVRVLSAGVDRRYPLRSLRWHTAHMKRLIRRHRNNIDQLDSAYSRRRKADLRNYNKARKRFARRHDWKKVRQLFAEYTVKRIAARAEYRTKRQPLVPDYYNSLRKADARFDPYINAVLAVSHVEHIRKKHFGRYKCYRSNGKKLCGTFRGASARMFAATGYHLGTGGMIKGIALTQAHYFQQYIARARDLGNAFKQNRSYSIKVMRNQQRYNRLILSHSLTPDSVARAFRYRSVANNLFREHEVTLPKDVYERLQKANSALVSQNTPKK